MTDTWTSIGGIVGVAQDSVSFTIGDKGYRALGYKDIWFRSIYEYDQSTGLWTSKTVLPRTGIVSAGFFSTDIDGYAVTGSTSGGYIVDTWQYNQLSNSWTQKANFGGVARRRACGYTIANKGYVGTGQNGGALGDLWKYDPDDNSWTQKTNFGGSARTLAVGFSIGSKGYIGTGGHADFWEYNIDNTWTRKADRDARYASVAFTVGNYGYVATGKLGAAYLKTVYRYNPSDNSWTQMTDYGGDARSNAVGFSIGSKGYLGSGLGPAYKSDFYEWCCGAVTLSGTISDEFGNPIRDAAITISNGTTYITTTDENGAYSQVVNSDTYDIAVSKSRSRFHDTTESSVAVTADTTQDITMPTDKMLGRPTIVNGMSIPGGISMGRSRR